MSIFTKNVGNVLTPQHKKQFFTGLALLIIIFIASSCLQDVVQYRFIIGLCFGFALIKGSIGFAGIINRGYRFGSFDLAKLVVWLFVVASVITAACFLGTGTKGLDVHQINLGLLIGSFMFGIGMAFASACASGVLQDMGTNPLAPFIVVVFFCIGVLVGFHAQTHWGIVLNTWINTPTTPRGVWFPDFFGGNTVAGYLGGTIIMIIFATIFTLIFSHYAIKSKEAGKATPVEDEIERNLTLVEKRKDASVFEKIFILPWTMLESGIMVVITATALFIATRHSWGVTTPFGYLAGRVLVVLGFPVDTLAEYTGKGAGSFTGSFFAAQGQMQNLGIFIGAIIASLMLGIFVLKDKVSGKKFVFLIAAGLLMGVGTRLSNGCNIGALYSPLSHMSLSGWIWFTGMLLGGVVGNIIKKRAAF